MKLILAAVLGGLIMFAWGSVSHLYLGIGQGTPMPNEEAMAAALKASINEPGLYYLPGMAGGKQPTQEEWDAWVARYKTGPVALVLYRPTGDEPMSARQMIVELGSNIAAALVVGMILTFAYVSWGRGVIIATLVGFSGWLSINVSYWNWYGFPTNFVTGELIEQVVGWLLSGFVLGYILRRRT